MRWACRSVDGVAVGGGLHAQRGASSASVVRVSLARGIIPHAGATSMELYHKDPHDPREEAVQPDDIRLQTRLTLRNHKEILDWLGLGCRNVVKLTRYQTRMEESPAIEAVISRYLGDWRPCRTARAVRTGIPGTRLLVVIAAVAPRGRVGRFTPRQAGPKGPPYD